MSEQPENDIDVSLTAEEAQSEIKRLRQLLAERTREIEEERRQKEEERRLTVESDNNKTSTPGTTDVSGRFYPKRFLAWTDFDTLHVDNFTQLERTLGSAALFPSRNVLQALGENSSPLVSDELDLRPFLRNAVEKPAALIVTQYLATTRHSKLSSFKFRSSSYGED
ncbi:MAG: hypothetical protein SEPTF4163_000920 [Sporothrix epigloea]